MKAIRLSTTLLMAVLLLLGALLAPAGVQGAAAAAKAITLDLDGTPLSSDVPPYLTPRNVTMVPLAVISRGLGAGVSWDQAAKTATITDRGLVLKLTNGRSSAIVGGVSVPLENAVVIRSGRVMVPIRFVSTQLGLQVNWDQTAKHISLISRTAETPDAGGPQLPAVPSVPVPGTPSVPQVPAVPGVTAKDMKGVWISTLPSGSGTKMGGLDWPTSAAYASPEKQRAEFDAMLDKLQAVGFNAVFVQVRSASDALYPSAYAPWSRVLTGTEGKDPGYDPLAYMIEAAHKRGMAFHAWFNPFRAATSSSASAVAALAPGHVAKQQPQWIVDAGGKLYLDPGQPAAREHIIASIMEVVSKYNVDGIHLDDYFYPSNTAFADDAAFRLYNPAGLAKADWRRDNINAFVRDLGTSIHAVKPQLSYGISPFGVWRNIKDDPTGSDTRAGVPAYDTMFADTRTWIKQGWIDYIAPQIYWSLSFQAARYDTLVDWWVNEVKGTGVKLYIGHAAYKVGDSSQSAEWQTAQQIITQLQYNDQYPQVDGSIMFRAAHIVGNDPFGLGGLLSLYYNP